MCTHVGEAAVERDEESLVASCRCEDLVIGRSGEVLTVDAVGVVSELYYGG